MENYFVGCLSLNEAKHRYLAFARKHHPAFGGNPGDLLMVILEFRMIPRDPSFGFNQFPEDVKEDFRHFPELLDRLFKWKLEVELIGTWTWVSGNTYPYREQLTELGFIYEATKMVWYNRPASCRSANPKPLPFDRIRALHHQNFANMLLGIEKQ